MKIQIALLPFLICIALMANGQSSNSEKAKEALIKADKAWSLAARTNDMEKLWSFWEDDAIILMSADLTIKGIDQIKNFTTQARTDPNFMISWDVQGAKISEHGDMGYTFGIGSVQRTSNSGEVISITKPYLSVWKRQPDGAWKCTIEN